MNVTLVHWCMNGNVWAATNCGLGDAMRVGGWGGVLRRKQGNLVHERYLVHEWYIGA